MNWGRVRSMDFSIYNVRRRVDEYYHLFEGKNKSHNNEQNVYRLSSVGGISSFIIDTDFFHIVIRSDSYKNFNADMKVIIAGSFYEMLYLKKNGEYVPTEKDFFLSDIRTIEDLEGRLPELPELFLTKGTSLNYIDYVLGNDKSNSILLGFRLEGSENKIDTSLSLLPIGIIDKAYLRIEKQ